MTRLLLPSLVIVASLGPLGCSNKGGREGKVTVTRIGLVLLAGVVGALLAGFLFGIAATIYAEIAESLDPPEHLGYGLIVAFCVIAWAIGGGIAGMSAPLMRGKARFLVPAVLGAGAGIVFSIGVPLRVRGGSETMNTLAMVGGVLGFGSVGLMIGFGVGLVCGVVVGGLWPVNDRVRNAP